MNERTRDGSVRNLQTLYTVVISLAVTQLLKNLVQDYRGWTETFTIDLLMALAFIATIIPFYHGANQYLNKTYIHDKDSSPDYALLIDFIMLFIQALTFFIISHIHSQDEFYYGIMVLLGIDILWVGWTYFPQRNDAEFLGNFKMYGKWALLNIITIVFTYLILSLRIDIWNDPITQSILLFGVYLFRTVIDYIIVWKFYYS